MNFLLILVHSKCKAMGFQEINKEQVGELNFPHSDVLLTDQERKQRKADLERAMSLGNLEQVKVKIYFEDDQEKRFVDTTIWGVTDESIILKQGVVIPFRRIFKVL